MSVWRRFHVGKAECVDRRRCLRDLVHRGGLRANVLSRRRDLRG